MVARLAFAFLFIGWTTALVVNPSEEFRLAACVEKYADGLDKITPNLSWAIRRHPLKTAHTSQRNFFILPGSGTAATRSLHYALEGLDMCGWHFNNNERWTTELLSTIYASDHDAMNCHKHLQVFDYTSLPSHVEYVADTPMAELFLDLFLSFPNAKVILQTRPALEWAQARMDFCKNCRAPIQEPCGAGRTCDSFTVQQLARLENLKNDLVRCTVANERLLEFDPFSDPPERIAQIMEEIGAFVGRPVGGVTFPGGRGDTRHMRDSIAPAAPACEAKTSQHR